MLNPLNLDLIQPLHTILDKKLPLRLQFVLNQIHVIHGAQTQNAVARPLRADTVHERAARLAEEVCHFETRGYGLVVDELGKIGLSAKVFEVSGKFLVCEVNF